MTKKRTATEDPSPIQSSIGVNDWNQLTVVNMGSSEVPEDPDFKNA